jgi:putative ABC transport system permease protein
MSKVWQDVRYALRSLAKSPGFTAIAVLTLALGIGANTAIFSVVYGALLSPLPYPEPDQLVMVWSTVRGNNNSVSAGDYLDWKRENSAFQDLLAFTGGSFSLSGSGKPEVVQTRILSPGWFNLQGIPFFLGRDFRADEGTVGQDQVVVMTHQFWKERFGGDPQIIGHELRLDGHPYSVIGVLAAGMPDRFESQLFVPLAFKPEQINHDFHWLNVLGRLKRGVTLQQANADMKGVAEHVAETYPLSNKGWGVAVEPLKNDFTSRDTIKDLWLLTGAVGFVLLIACVNVANLLLARGTIRQKEVAVRASLGATRGQLFSQFLTEGLVLAIIGGTLGITLATLILRVILILLPQYSLPTEADIRINLPVLFFSLAATVTAGLLSGCAPAWRISQQNLNNALKEGGRSVANIGRHGMRRWLVVLEFALALTLLAGAGLAIHSFWKLTRADLGFRPDHVLTSYLPIPVERLSQPKQIIAFYRQLLAKVSSLPGAASAAVSTGAPIAGTNDTMPFSVAGQPVNDLASRPSAGFAMVSPDYFRTFGIAIAAGRGFTEQDVEDGLPVAIVNETFAKKYLTGLDPLRQRLVVEQLIPGANRLGPPMEW